MNTLKSFNMAIASIFSNKMRSFLTMLGIIIGISSVIILVGIMNGLTKQVYEIFDEIGTTTVNVSIMRAGSSRGIKAKDMYAFAEKNSKSISGLSPLVSVNASVKTAGSSDSLSSSVTGVSEQYFKDDEALEDGRMIQYADIENSNNVCLIGSYVKNKLFPEGSAVGQTLRINAATYTVVGVFKEKDGSQEGTGDDVIYIPYTGAAKLSGNANIRSYRIYAANEAEVDNAIALVEKFLTEAFGGSDDYRVIGMKQMLDEFNKITSIMTASLVVIAGISLLVGGIGIMNIMLVSVTERTKEIGIRKALGARRKDVLSQFVIEAATVSGIGGVIGIIFGSAVTVLAGMLIDIQARPTATAVMVSFSVSVAIGIMFGFLPANKASKLNPIDALRFE